VGKTSTARIIAKALNCVNGPTATPCNACVNCVSITAGNHPDVIEIDGASNTGINDVRIIQEEIMYPPVNAKYKVYIIDEVHMLSKSAFNALLKTIEEPPKGVVFIFATTEINKVLATIRSRCQIFNLRLIPTDVIYKSLTKVLDSYNVKYEENAVKWIASEGRGSMRDAYTLLDQVVSFCNNDITLKVIQEKLGLVGEEKISKMALCILNSNRRDLLLEYDNILISGIAPEQIIAEFIKYFRNILFARLNLPFDSAASDQATCYSKAIIEAFSYEDIENILEILFNTYEKSRYTTDIKLEIEACLIKLLNFKEFIRPKQIIKELKMLRQSFFQNTSPVYMKEDAVGGGVKKNEFINEGLFQTGPANIVETKTAPSVQNVQQPKTIKVTPQKSDIIKLVKDRVSPTNIQLLSALNNIDSIEEQGAKMTLYFSQKMYYDNALKFKDLIANEASAIVGKEQIIEIEYKPPNSESKEMSVDEYNRMKLKEIFYGKDFNL
ncbi:MAG TPA: DNA polymerase III subunit gamma/tau, partial [Spirochaetota bacterium]|nr:DNA polymerase III subunit gamma/tau [Spirochaetota bacterium]